MGNIVYLGDKVKDRVSGFIGIAIAKTFWMNGCTRCVVQAPSKDSSKDNTATFDEPQLDIVKRHAVKVSVDLPESMPVYDPKPIKASKEKKTQPTHGDRDDTHANRRF